MTTERRYDLLVAFDGSLHGEAPAGAGLGPDGERARLEGAVHLVERDGAIVAGHREPASVYVHQQDDDQPPLLTVGGRLPAVPLSGQDLRLLLGEAVRIELPVVRPAAAQVRAEAQRRILLMMGAETLDACLIRQLNASMRATELVNKRAKGEALSPAELAEEAALEAMAGAIKAIRAASNAMEAEPPADFASDGRWP